MTAAVVPHLAEADPLDHMLPVDQLLPPVSSESAILSGASASRFSAWKRVGLGIVLGLGVLGFGIWIAVMATKIPVPAHTTVLMSVRRASSVVDQIPQDILIATTWKESARAQWLLPHVFGVARAEDGSWNAFTISPRWIHLNGYRKTRGLIQLVSEKPWNTPEGGTRLGSRYAWSGARLWSQTSGELRVGEIFGSDDTPIAFRGSLTRGFLRTNMSIGSWDAMALPLGDVAGRGTTFQFLPMLPACNSLRVPMIAMLSNPTSSVLSISHPCEEDESWTLEAKDKETIGRITETIAELFFPNHENIKLEDETSATERLFGREEHVTSSRIIGSHVLERVENRLLFQTTTTESGTKTASCGNHTDLLALSGTVLHRLIPTVIGTSSTRHFVFGETGENLSLCWME